MSNPEDKSKIIVDEDWKAQVQAEKEAMERGQSEPGPEAQQATSGEEAAERAAAQESSSAESPRADGGRAEAGGKIPPPPPASFPQLVTIFAMQASVSLQQAADPNEKETSTHLDYARHFIDLLSLIEQKTKGNLTDEEAKMLETTIHELRMAYVSMRKS